MDFRYMDTAVIISRSKRFSYMANVHGQLQIRVEQPDPPGSFGIRVNDALTRRPDVASPHLTYNRTNGYAARSFIHDVIDLSFD